MQGYACCFFSVAGLPEASFGKSDYGEETAFVPQACITARKTLKTGWRSSYKTHKTYKTNETYFTIDMCPLRAADLPGSGPQW